MAISDTRETVIANCETCGAVMGAELTDDGSIVPLGSSNECACGCRAFQIFR